MKKDFLIIGVGRFGSSVIRELKKQGHEIVACDTREQFLKQTDEYVNHSIIGDATDIHLLKELNVSDFDSIVVSIGDNFEAAVLIVNNLKNLKCKNVITKANDHIKGDILKRVGADEVIYPEEETGTRVARRLSNPGVLEYVQLAPQCSGIEMQVPEEFFGKTLVELDFRKKYEATVVMISKENEEYPDISPYPNTKLEKGDIFFIVGNTEALEKFKNKYT